jgi:NAD(P)-dependent dehydrogenase (short-subunit alcohol dehydrogenase family)
MAAPEEGKPLTGRVAVVAGATRGAGRGIAAMLGAAGASVYCTGRSTRAARSPMNRPETIEETADMVSARGGAGIAVRVDHTKEEEVAALFARVRADHGRLDILVNDIWGGDEIVGWGKRFWEIDMGAARALIDQAVLSHMITARFGAPLLIESGAGLIVEVTDGHTPGYRGQALHDFCKAASIRMAYEMAWDLLDKNVAALAVSPGFLRSEAMLERFAVTEETWREAIAQDPFFAESETPFLVGRAVAALAGDRDVMRKTGGAYWASDLAIEYGFTDVDGRTPRFWQAYDALLDAARAAGPPDARAQNLAIHRYASLHLSPDGAARAEALAAWIDFTPRGGLAPLQGLAGQRAPR